MQRIAVGIGRDRGFSLFNCGNQILGRVEALLRQEKLRIDRAQVAGPIRM